jgi:Ca2+-binding RTX toxin-like protein
VTFSSSANNLSAEDADGTNDAYVRDLQTDTTILASRADGPAGAAGADESGTSTLSADGRLVAFHSLADNLSTEDDNAVRNVFVRDLLAGTTRLVSRAPGPAGAAATGGDSAFPVLAAGGRHVAFESAADNLSADDVNSVNNLFVRSLPPPAALGGSGGGAGGGAPPPAARARTARCGGLRATIVGTARRDVIRGTARRDVIAALAGNDLVRGLGGNDLICLGAGNDRALGGAGADRVLGGTGADRVLGGPGADVLLGGPGADVLLGGPGADRLLGQAGRDRAVGGPGRDVCPAEVRAAC